MLEWLKRALLTMGLVVLSQSAWGKAEPSVSILMYHHVSESTPRSTSVSPDELRAHLQYLHDNDFTVIDLRDAIAAIDGEQDLPDKAVVLTFDDAYQNIYQNGHPILQEFDVPYTLFVTTNPVGQTPGQYMSWDQIRALHEDGVTIANHTLDHAHMPRRLDGESEEEWRQRMAENILQAEQKILDEVGVSYQLFAYPYGEYDNKLANLVKELGFTGFGQHSGAFGPSSDRRAIPRFAAAGIYANLNTLSTKMAALAFPIEDVRYEDTLLAHKEARPALEIEFEVRDFRPHQVNCFIRSQPHEVEWLDDNTMRIRADEPLNVGRSRYNCTAPSISKAGRYYWYSMQWIREDENGSWPD
ncbi:polysaccharide deacetylase family protein [Aliidiomarina sp. Khilg15.8]